MAFPKLIFLLSVIVPSIFANFMLAAATEPDDDPLSLSNAAEVELHRLTSRISSLEMSIEDQTVEMRIKDGGIKQMEKLIEEKSKFLTSLQAKVQSFKESLESKPIEEIKKRVNELEKQVVNVKREIKAQSKKKDALEARANAAEIKIEELNSKLKSLERINDEQKSRIHQTQHALEVAEEEMLKAKVEASTATKQLKEVNQAWLPPWFYAHLVHCQSFVLTYWNEIVGPAINQSIHKVPQLKYEIEKFLQHYLATIKSKCFPTIKEQYVIIVDNLYPLVQSFSTQAIEYYHLAQSTIRPHIENAIETEAKLFMIPYADQVSEISKPLLDKVRLFLKPYSKKVVYYHRYITRNVQEYHSLIQATLHETLNSFQLTKPFAEESLVRFMASVLMALPVIVVFRMLPLPERRKPRHSTRRNHNRKQHRRTHGDY